MGLFLHAAGCKNFLLLAILLRFVLSHCLRTITSSGTTLPPRQHQAHFRLHQAKLMSANDHPQQPKEKKVRVLGVCGGIGSGKSAACKILVAELNCLAHIDSDKLAHTIYEKGSQAMSDVVAEFGADLIDATSGEIDRRRLGTIVFSDIQAMRKLEQIVWPHVQAKIAAEIERAKDGFENSQKTPVIVVEAAVLLDAGWQDFLDGVWVVSVPPSKAIQRLQENRNLTVEDAEQRIAAQQSRRGIGNLEDEVRTKVVSAVIENSGSLEDLRERLAEKLNDRTAWYINKQIIQ